MDKFLYKNKLNDEQKSRWDWAVCKYREIREKNMLNSFEELDEKERNSLMLELSKVKEFNGSLTLNMLDEKSALFGRLLSGKNPLLYPPPCAYSYPWYDVIEESGPWSLSFESENLEEIILENLNGESHILIEQTPWKVLDKISGTEVIVTFGNWEQLGFKWLLTKVKKSCKETKSFIYCYHKPDESRITTYEDLKNEQFYHVNKELDKIKLVLNVDFKIKYKQYLFEKYGDNKFTESILLSEIKTGQEILDERRSLGLSDIPSTEEINKMVEYKIEEYFKSGYSQDNEGNLFIEVWILKKIQGEVKQTIYMKF